MRADFLKRPEFLTLLVAIIVSAMVALGLPQAAGLPVPEAALSQIVILFWLVAIGALLEGAYKPDYAGGVVRLLGSTKFRLAAVGLIGAVVVGLFEAWFGMAVPEDALHEVLNWLMVAVAAKAGLDVVAEVNKPEVKETE